MGVLCDWVVSVESFMLWVVCGESFMWWEVCGEVL